MSGLNQSTAEKGAIATAVATERKRCAAWLRWYDGKETRRSEAIEAGHHWDWEGPAEGGDACANVQPNSMAPAGWNFERSGAVIKAIAPDGVYWFVAREDDAREDKIGAFFWTLCDAIASAPASEMWHPVSEPLQYLTRCSDGTTFLNHVDHASIPAHAVEWAIPAQCATVKDGWHPIEQGKPPANKRVLATYLNRLGNRRTIIARWTPAKTVEANDDDDGPGTCEYDEATDTYYLVEGWWECIDNWDDYSQVVVHEGEITHWAPLPSAP